MARDASINADSRRCPPGVIDGESIPRLEGRSEELFGGKAISTHPGLLSSLCVNAF
jgi:hypothetical protein